MSLRLCCSADTRGKAIARTLWIAAGATLSLAAAFAQRVKVVGGLVQGTVENGLTVYRGIPFAAPTQGDLRWKPRTGAE